MATKADGQMALADLKPDARNARKHNERNVQLIVEALGEVGAARSIVIDEDGVILAGNATVEAAAQAGLERVQVVEGDGKTLIAVRRRGLTRKEKQRLALYDNRSAELATWDDEVLRALKAEDKRMFEGLFEDAELEALLGGDGVLRDAEPQVDRAEELREKWGVERGQLWGLGEHRLLCGDCTDMAFVERVMDGQKAQMGLTSPPYGVGKEYERGVGFADLLRLLDNVALIGKTVIIPGGYFFVNFGDIHSQAHTMPITGVKGFNSYHIASDYYRIFRTHDWRLYAERVWRKPFERLMPPYWSYQTTVPHHMEWEYLWTFQNGDGQDGFGTLIIERVPKQADDNELSDYEDARRWCEMLFNVAAGIPGDGFDYIWTWRQPGGGKERMDKKRWKLSVNAIWDTRREMTEDKPLTRHSAAFPLALPVRAIQVYSDRNEIVWEPFNGSGTTLMACENLGRQCRGMEIVPGYVAVTLERFWQATGIEPVLMEQGEG